MKVFYSNDFTGYCPIGVAAVVVAENKQTAKNILTAYLAECRMKQKGDFTVHEVETYTAQVFMLNNGDY